MLSLNNGAMTSSLKCHSSLTSLLQYSDLLENVVLFLERDLRP